DCTVSYTAKREFEDGARRTEFRRLSFAENWSQLRAEFLRKCSAFSMLPSSTLMAVLKHVQLVSFEKGEELFEEGTPRDRILIVHSGEVSVTTRGKHSSYKVPAGCAAVGLMFMLLSLDDVTTVPHVSTAVAIT
ncbi:Neuropathy target esterase, partial [Perkinsus olseni]